MPATLFEKLWRQHRIADLGDGVALIAIDRVMLHERTGGVALDSLSKSGRTVLAPGQAFAVMDHIVDTLPGRSDATKMPTGMAFITGTRAAAHAAGIGLFDLDDPRQGICHVISPEQGIVLPGVTLVCPDSHTGTQGAFGALAWGIGSSEAEHALATGTLRVRKPRTMRITVRGRLAAAVGAKDLALHIIAQVGSAGAQGHAVEFAGDGVAALDIEQRQTLCNMATEMSAFCAIIAPDDVSISALEGTPLAPTGAQWDQAVAAWRTLASDRDAAFDRDIAIDADEVAPMISWGTSPQQSIPVTGTVPRGEAETEANHRRALAYMGLEAGEALAGLRIDAAFIGSCTNSRLSDLRRAAAVVQGRRVAEGIRAICVPGSGAVKRAAEAEGIADTLIAAGFEWREPGCSMCFFAGGESFGLRERVVSTTNRNFESRQGPETRTHIASPELVAASAIAGRIVDPREA
ncbi:3-isopropylmalate dehydratase large subunit [Sphingomonas sp. HF-S4]|uniref:3-isopropylmalate dehydratase n=1 Tax=Sphingomonas agrestis TaxID=3080540 RepID=A0ABU3Y4D8_9SPHN|nr:3-isopropylmalate dehydratase large subunit [Sphingomonas sp. HF-S4]MDV3456083.1 3-isopropylmalate dehydratase large subunit [Sphingomonas sp. HF-S4]